MNKEEAIQHIEDHINELQVILNPNNLKSMCINKPHRRSLYSAEAGRIIQIQGIVDFLKKTFDITEEDLR